MTTRATGPGATLSPLPLETARVLLCDADGSLFPSEDPAFVASTKVTNRFMEAFGRDRRFSAEELRLQTTGKNFRATIADLAVDAGIALAPELAERLGRADAPGTGQAPVLTAEDFDEWVAAEKREVSAYLGDVLAPDPEIIDAISALAERYTLSVVSSSALSRLDVCFRATGLAELFPAERRYSAEDSLPVPTSKPDPAVYVHAGEQLGISKEQGIAIEDSGSGALSAVGAGFATIGNVRFVAEDERAERRHALTEAGVSAFMSSWTEAPGLLL